MANPWIDWEGGLKPSELKPHDIVEVTYRDSSYDTELASVWVWYHTGDVDDIVKYRLAGEIGKAVFKDKHPEPIFDDPEALDMIYALKNRGYIVEQIISAFVTL